MVRRPPPQRPPGRLQTTGGSEGDGKRALAKHEKNKGGESRSYVKVVTTTRQGAQARARGTVAAPLTCMPCQFQVGLRFEGLPEPALPPPRRFRGAAGATGASGSEGFASASRGPLDRVPRAAPVRPASEDLSGSGGTARGVPSLKAGAGRFGEASVCFLLFVAARRGDG